MPISTELSPIISVQVVKSLVCSGATTTGKVLAKEVGVHRESIRFRGCGEERAGGGDPDARRHVLSRFGVSGGVFTLPGGFQHDAGTGIHGLLLEHFSHGPVGDDRDALSAAAFRGNGRTGCLLGIVEDHEPQAHATEEQDRQPPGHGRSAAATGAFGIAPSTARALDVHAVSLEPIDTTIPPIIARSRRVRCRVSHSGDN